MLYHFSYKLFKAEIKHQKNMFIVITRVDKFIIYCLSYFRLIVTATFYLQYLRPILSLNSAFNLQAEYSKKLILQL